MLQLTGVLRGVVGFFRFDLIEVGNHDAAVRKMCHDNEAPQIADAQVQGVMAGAGIFCSGRAQGYVLIEISAKILPRSRSMGPMRKGSKPVPRTPTVRSALSPHVRPMGIAKMGMMISSRCS